MAGSDPAGRPLRARLGHRQRPRGPSLFLDRSRSRSIAATPGAPKWVSVAPGIPVGSPVLVRVSCELAVTPRARRLQLNRGMIGFDFGG